MKCQCNAPLKTQIFRKSSLKLPVCPIHYSDIQTSVSNRTARKALLEPFKEQTILIWSGTLVQKEEANEGERKYIFSRYKSWFEILCQFHPQPRTAWPPSLLSAAAAPRDGTGREVKQETAKGNSTETETMAKPPPPHSPRTLGTEV